MLRITPGAFLLGAGLSVLCVVYALSQGRGFGAALFLFAFVANLVLYRAARQRERLASDAQRGNER